MSSSQERAKALVLEIQEAMRAVKAAEARVKQLSQELTQALAQARVEAEAALTIAEYPAGGYECGSCGHSTLFTEPTRALPACDNCGSRNWVGHEATIMKIEPPPPKRFPAGMYGCVACGGRTAVAMDTDELSPCDLCGATDFKPIQI